MKMEVLYFGYFQRDGESPLKIPVAYPGPVLRGKDKVGTEIPHFLIAGLSLEWMRRVLPYPGSIFLTGYSFLLYSTYLKANSFHFFAAHSLKAPAPLSEQTTTQRCAMRSRSSFRGGTEAARDAVGKALAKLKKKCFGRCSSYKRSFGQESSQAERSSTGNRGGKAMRFLILGTGGGRRLLRSETSTSR